MKDKLIFKNGTEIELEAGASLSAMEVLSETKEAMISTWENFIPENLKEVKIKNGDGVVVGNYENLALVAETSIIQDNGTILTSFNLREKSEIEKRLEALEEAKGIQDGAIDDLGVVVSLLSEDKED
jgi:hypothetical protein